MDIMESPVKMASQSNAHHHNRTIVVRHPRHYYGRQYSRRNSTHHTDASSSQGKVTPLHNDRLSFKLARQGNSESSRHAGNFPKGFWLRNTSKALVYILRY